MSEKTLAALNNGHGLSNAMNMLFNPWNDWFHEPWSKTLTIPAANVSEAEDCYVLSLAAPGLSKDDFRIDIKGNHLSVNAHQEHKKEDNGGRKSRCEYNYSSFTRSFALPEEVDRERIEAEYKDGVLEIMLPKHEAARSVSPTRVEVR